MFNDKIMIMKISGMILVFLLLFGLSGTYAGTSIFWGNLEAGPYAVGFTTEEMYDYTRSFMPKYDYNGDLLPGEKARPIQVCIWYPADDSNDEKAMVYGEYVYPYPGDAEFSNLVSNMQARELGFLQRLMAGNRAAVQDLLNLKMKAVKNAPAVFDSFPLIIYYGNIMTGYSENLVLCEYLASHGYVVATTHSMGGREYNPQPEAGDIEAMARDKEVVLSFMTDMDMAEENKLGLLGSGFGGLSALVMQMRNQNADAVAAIEGSFIFSDYKELSEQHPNFITGDLQVPLLAIYGGSQDGHDISILDSFRYSDRYSVEMAGMNAGDFGHYSFFDASSDHDTTGRIKKIHTGYEVSCREILDFFNTYLKNDKNGLASLQNIATDSTIANVSFSAGMKRPPNEDEFFGIIRDEGGARGVELYEKFSEQEPDHLLFREPMMNALGYQLLQSNRLDDALEVFRLNTLAYPNSANCWDSYAELLIAIGDNETAMNCARKVLEILPADSTTNPQLKAMIEANARERLGLDQLEDESN